jgi:hypothetical protein
MNEIMICCGIAVSLFVFHHIFAFTFRAAQVGLASAPRTW